VTIVLGGVQLTMSISSVQRAVNGDTAEQELRWQRQLQEAEVRRARALQAMGDPTCELRRWA
jgi:hypothetical protein